MGGGFCSIGSGRNGTGVRACLDLCDWELLSLLPLTLPTSNPKVNTDFSRPAPVLLHTCIPAQT